LVHVPYFRILVVEDHAHVRRFICSLLQQRAELRLVGEASDGLEAIELARSLHPDLILIDIGLPRLNGIEAARQIRRFDTTTKLLFVSLESSPEVVREALRVGAQGFVHKQHAQRDLLPAIEEVLNGKHYVSNDEAFQERVYTRHEVQFYSNEDVLLGSALPFLAAAMRAGAPAVVVATKPHRESLARKLREEDVGLDDAVQRGTYISLDAAEAVSRVVIDGNLDRARSLQGLKRLIDSVARASNATYPRVAIFGECAPVLCAQHNVDAAVRLENTVNDVFKTHHVDILCAYSLSVVHPGDRGAYSRICKEHTAVHSR
jgi:CheY-like chemotaxis protein